MDYFVQRGKNRFGPFDGRQLKRLAKSGKLRQDDLVSHGAGAKSVAASMVRGLFTTPKPAREGEQAVRSRAGENSQATEQIASARLAVLHEVNVLLGNVPDWSLFIDDEPVGTLVNGQVLGVTVSPGIHTLAASVTGSMLMPAEIEIPNNSDVLVKVKSRTGLLQGSLQVVEQKPLATGEFDRLAKVASDVTVRSSDTTKTFTTLEAKTKPFVGKPKPYEIVATPECLKFYCKGSSDAEFEVSRDDAASVILRGTSLTVEPPGLEKRVFYLVPPRDAKDKKSELKQRIARLWAWQQDLSEKDLTLLCWWVGQNKNMPPSDDTPGFEILQRYHDSLESQNATMRTVGWAIAGPVLVLIGVPLFALGQTSFTRYSGLVAIIKGCIALLYVCQALERKRLAGK